MGTVIGQGGGFGGGLISNERLIQNAEDDAREKADAMDADYVQLGQASLGQQEGTTTTATVTGTAFDCTPDALPSAPASASGAAEGGSCASHADCAADLFCDSIRHVCARP